MVPDIDRVHDGRGNAVGVAVGSKLKANILNFKQKLEKANSEWHKSSNSQILHTIKYLPPQKAITPNVRAKNYILMFNYHALDI